MPPSDFPKFRNRAITLANAQRVLLLARKAKGITLKEDIAPVVFFNASTRLGGTSLNAAYAFLTSVGLQLEGVPVVHFACRAGMTRCQLGTDPDDHLKPPPCTRCVLQSRVLTANAETRWFDFARNPGLEQAMEKLSVEGLSDLYYQGIPLGSLTLPSLQWTLRRFHLRDDAPTRHLFREFIASAYQVAQEFEKLLQDVKPQAVVVFNGITFPEGTARWVAQQRGIRVVTHEVAHQPITAFFSYQHVTSYPVDIPEDFELSPTQNKRMDEYLTQRFKGNFSMAGVTFWPEIHNLDPAFLEKAARFDQIVPVFTNVIFDTSQLHANKVFQHMFAWLDQVLSLAKENPKTLFVLRAHPDEMRPGKSSRESVAQWVQDSGAGALPNVHFIPATEYLSSYELIQMAKFSMVYNSTIGLEAALMGKPVLNGGHARYTRYPSVYLPVSPEEHRTMAQGMLDADEVETPVDFLRNARRFQYYQLYRTPLPFEQFIKPHSTRGYVKFKAFDLQDLSVQRSPTMKVITEGILHNGDFLMPDMTA